jgi:hypothetical protein
MARRPAPRLRDPAHRRVQKAQAQVARDKHAFLECYRQWANISFACEQTGVARRNIYNWQETDETFALAFKVAGEQATERLEREAWRRAVEGSPYERTSYYRGEKLGTDLKTEYSDQLMMLLLRARKPDVYRERLDVAVNQVVKAIAGVDPQSVL